MKIMRVEGVRGLWRGLGTALLLTVPANSLCVTKFHLRRAHDQSLIHSFITVISCFMTERRVDLIDDTQL